MKKRITACLLALALAAGMTSCGKTDTSGQDSSDDLRKPKDMIQASATVITNSETTTTAETTAAELADKDSGGEETTTKKKKKKKKTETKKSDSKKKETKAKETKAKETEAEEPKAGTEKTFTFENSIYTMEMSEDKWLSVSDYKKILEQSAGASNGIYSVDDLDKIVGNIYFYNENSGLNQTVVVISNPIYQASISNVKLEDVYDQLLASIQPQFESQNSITLLSNQLVTHNGIKMMQLKAQGVRSGFTIDCDEYIFLKDGNLCVIAVTTNDKEKGLAEFNKTLDTIKYK